MSEFKCSECEYKSPLKVNIKLILQTIIYIRTIHI